MAKVAGFKKKRTTSSFAARQRIEDRLIILKKKLFGHIEAMQALNDEIGITQTEIIELESKLKEFSDVV